MLTIQKKQLGKLQSYFCTHNHFCSKINKNIDFSRHVEFIWSVRSAKVARQILPEIEETYGAIVNEWGAEKTHDVLSIRIHITEKNEDEAAAYRAEIRNSLLFKSKQIGKNST